MPKVAHFTRARLCWALVVIGGKISLIVSSPSGENQLATLVSSRLGQPKIPAY